jgi:hypothetical protein
LASCGWRCRHRCPSVIGSSSNLVMAVLTAICNECLKLSGKLGLFFLKMRNCIQTLPTQKHFYMQSKNNAYDPIQGPLPTPILTTARQSAVKETIRIFFIVSNPSGSSNLKPAHLHWIGTARGWVRRSVGFERTPDESGRRQNHIGSRSTSIQCHTQRDFCVEWPWQVWICRSRPPALHHICRPAI